MESVPCHPLALLLFFLILLFSKGAQSLNLEGPLMKTLLQGYNKNIRPAEYSMKITQVELKLTLTNLISLKEREEALTTSVWVEMQWYDYRLKWDHMPVYENVTRLRVPSKSIWLPDIILENNMDGKFEIALYVNALVDPSGHVFWLPPAIYRSACSIKVNYFPFDWQNCSMVFRADKHSFLHIVVHSGSSQTYNANEIELLLITEKGQTVEWIEIDPEAFTENGEWAIKHRPAKKIINNRYNRDELEFQELVFFLIIQRKPLFYVINIIVPSVLISSLSLLVYYLPAKAGGQKCTMSIAILLAQTVFLILIFKKVPETSQAVPLIGKYLMFVMSVTTIVVMNCVIVLNVSLRTPNTHLMTDKVRKVFLNILPRMLHMQMKPWTPAEPATPPSRRRSSLGLIAKADEYFLKTARSEIMFSKLRERNGLMRAMLEEIQKGPEGDKAQDVCASLAHASSAVKQCVVSCKHITESIRQQNRFQSESEEWFLVARVIDRACFFAMALLFIFGTIGIFLLGHFNQAPSMPFPDDPKTYLPEVKPQTA